MSIQEEYDSLITQLNTMAAEMESMSQVTATILKISNPEPTYTGAERRNTTSD